MEKYLIEVGYERKDGTNVTVSEEVDYAGVTADRSMLGYLHMQLHCLAGAIEWLLESKGIPWWNYIEFVVRETFVGDTYSEVMLCCVDRRSHRYSVYATARCYKRQPSTE